MSIAIKSAFWIATFGGIGWGLYCVVKPSDETLTKINDNYKHTDSVKLSTQAVKVLQQATEQNSELSKKIDELLKKGK